MRVSMPALLTMTSRRPKVSTAVWTICVQILRLADVGVDADGLAAGLLDAGDEVGRGLGVRDIVDDDVGALGRGGEDDRLTDPGVAAGDDHGLTVEEHQVPSLGRHLRPSCESTPAGRRLAGSGAATTAGRGRPGRRCPEVVAHPAESRVERGDVVLGESREELLAQDRDVAGEHRPEPRGRHPLSSPSTPRSSSTDGARVDEAGALEQSGLMGETAAAVDDPVGQVGHAHRALG